MIRSPIVLLTAALGLLAAVPARGEEPAVARPSLRTGEKSEPRGVVFFLRAGVTGAAAVGTAHTFDLRQLVRADSVDFSLGNTGRPVGRSTHLLVPPGRPFTIPGATLRDDFLVYALDAPPEGVRVLDPERVARPRPGARVRILGIPSEIPQDEDDIFGRIAIVSEDFIEVDLDVTYDLRGWGGAPVLDAETGRVIGMLQAYWPRGSTARVSVGPIEGVLERIASPLGDGQGRAFAQFGNQVAQIEAGDEIVDTPPPHRSAPAPPRTAPGSGMPPSPPSHATNAPPEMTAAARPPAGGSLLATEPIDPTSITLEVEYPPKGVPVQNSACGLFVAGRAVAMKGPLRRFDVVLVLDTSRSTVDPTGADINGNGLIGKPRLGRLGSMFDAGSTDPGDSILAAEVAAARQLLRGLDPRSTRVAVVAFAGEPPGASGSLFSRKPRPPAITIEPLTADYGRVERALAFILSQEPEGSTHMAAGVDQATIELMGLRGSLSKVDRASEKVVMFFTDGQATLPYGPGAEADNVRAVLRAADRASRAQIRIHSFAIGPDALDGPIATVEMALRTHGYFTPVRHPGDLVDAVDQVNFANLDGIQIRSLTAGGEAEIVRATADGSWSGFVPAAEGVNEIEVVARADDGTETSRTITIDYRPNVESPPLPANLMVTRNRLLEDCLRNLKQVRLQTEERQAEKVRRELQVEIEKERAQARQRAEEQRKRLELEVEETEPPPAQP